MSNKANTRHFTFSIITALILSFILITFSAKFTLNFKSLYYFDISYLNISEISGYSEDQIKENYSYVVDFVDSHKEIDFHLPSLEYSQNGKIHFEEVKAIFNFMDTVTYILLIVLIILIIYAIKKKDFEFLDFTTYLLFIIPLAILTPFLINFDYSFTLFHKILFNNDYWLFDPKYDPIINILPEKFFFHCLGLIVLLLVLCSIICRRLYKRLMHNAS